MADIKDGEITVKKEFLFKISVVQIICVTLILLGVILSKFIFKDEYKKIEKFYKDNLLKDTTVESVIRDMENEI
ncbi:MAG: hypothetical protein MJ091_03700 [Clostridia bacterium]|nr:hypothetical protein [Clostridia bacterium]